MKATKQIIEKVWSDYPTFLPYITKLAPYAKEVDCLHSGGHNYHYYIHLNNGHIFIYHETNGAFNYSADKWDSVTEYYCTEEGDLNGKIGGFGWEFLGKAKNLSKGFEIECEEDEIGEEEKKKLDNLINEIING